MDIKIFKRDDGTKVGLAEEINNLENQINEIKNEDIKVIQQINNNFNELTKMLKDIDERITKLEKKS